MLKAYSDEHVARAVVFGLRRRGMDVIRAIERGEGIDDEDHLRFAADEQRLMLTGDRDFLRLHAKWMRTGQHHHGIVYWRQDALDIGDAIAAIIRFALDTAPTDSIDCLHYLMKQEGYRT